MGTAGAVKNAPVSGEGLFLVFNGDVMTDIDLTRMVAFHRERQARATIALTPVEDPSSYGVVVTDGDQKVKQFIENYKRQCRLNRIDYVLLNSSWDYDIALMEYLILKVQRLLRLGLFLVASFRFLPPT